MELMPGVEETLARLGEVHELTLFTKGHPEEQHSKIDRSGLRSYFDHCAVVKEKNAAAYQALADERGFDSDRTWMIGNSPKSDINPALRPGCARFLFRMRAPGRWSMKRSRRSTSG